MKKIEDYIRTIPDFPKEGIMFRDISTVLSDPDGFALAIDQLQERLQGVDFDIITGMEARGFVFAAPLAYNLHKPLVLIRKKGKLPGETIEKTFEIEVQADSIRPGQKVVVVDDLIATGGTVEASAHLIEHMDGEVVKMLFVAELAGLEGRKRLAKYDIDALVTYPGK